MTRRVMGLFAITLCLLVATRSGADLHSGTGVVPWDFSDSTHVDDIFGPWDIAMIQFAADSEEGLQLVVGANWPGKIALMPDTVAFGELDFAPDDESLYQDDYYFVPDRVWVVRTIEGHYAKVWFDDYSGSFVYVYQDDGTRSFGGVPVRAVTWGQVKALYR
jgi:hypothetical protein